MTSAKRDRTEKPKGVDKLSKEFKKHEKRSKKRRDARRKRQEQQAQRKLAKKTPKKRRAQENPKKRLKNRQLLRKYLDKAGYEELDETRLTKNVFRTVILICLGITLLALLVASVNNAGVNKSLLFLTGVWTGIFAGLFVIAWVVLYVFLDIKVFKRTQQVEEVLPDFLQLASANISAGMPVERALWFAVRPRFGILAKEIEDVAKSTISGEDLKTALQRFASKYDSKTLKRSISLLIEGMESGGEMADLLNKIALNIQESRILKQEMSANVMTYAIFIGFASIAAAPVLFGLSGQLLVIIQSIMGQVGQGGASSGTLSISLAGDAVSKSDFRVFSLTTLFLTSMFSAFIISTIRKGNVKEGARLVPIFVLVALAVYFFASWLLSLLFGGLVSV